MHIWKPTANSSPPTEAFPDELKEPEQAITVSHLHSLNCPEKPEAAFISILVKI